MAECSIVEQEVTQNRSIENRSIQDQIFDPDRILGKEDEFEHETLTLHCKACGFSWVATLNCGDRTCLRCRKKWHGHHRDILKRIIQAWGTNIRVMTLTLRNIPDADFDRSSIKRLRKSFSRLLHRKYFKARIRGGFYVVHLTNIGNGWHPHIHVVYKGEFISKAILVRTWGNITGDSYIVDIKPMVGPKKALQYLLGDLFQRPRIRHRDIYKYNEALKRSRLIQGFGDYSRASFREPFLCPMCGNDTWYVPKFADRDRDEVIYDDTS